MPSFSLMYPHQSMAASFSEVADEMSLAKKHFTGALLPFFITLMMIVTGTGVSVAQNSGTVISPSSLLPPHPADKFEKRYYDIDAKRMGSDMYSDDALPRSREFKRIDSTYYVGWLFEGVYKYEHAADYLGYKNASIPLETALRQIEHDYRNALATRTDDVIKFIPVYRIQYDYSLIVYYLMTCYSNTDQNDKVYELLRRDLKWNFQFQFSMDAWNYLAWTVHRCRMYTSDKYYFLKNSIEENEKLANSYLDTSMLYIIKNSYLNNKLQPNSTNETNEKMGVYHYKNILYSYSFDIDSANYYFNLMRAGGRLPHNNYANFMDVCGEFRTAEEEYNIASQIDNGDKRLQEWAYYHSILDINKSKPKVGAELARNMIKAAGVTPGYGWYNIALARCMTYDGQVSEAKRYTDKAANFKELHIGTTLGQSQYDLSIQLIKLINKEQEWAMQKFEHANWWYNPMVLSKMGQLTADRYLEQFLIINQFAQNPERDRVIYELFSTESTISWDEIWYLVHDFTTKFFIERFENEAATDKRKNIRKYFKLYVARLKIQQGHYKEGNAMLDDLLDKENIDPEYEKLYEARICEAKAICAEHINESEEEQWLYKLYVIYPQLVPFSGFKMKMNLTIAGDPDKGVVDRLKDCNISFTNKYDPSAPDAFLVFTQKGDKKAVTYYVMDKKGNYVVPKQTITCQKPGETGIDLAYRLFNIGAVADGDKKDKDKNEPIMDVSR